MAVRKRDDLVIDQDQQVLNLAAALDAKLMQLFGRSLKLRQVSAGGCNACESDVNVLGTQRVNRAALPHLRAQRSGHVVWVGSSSTRGGTPPYLAPYFAAKAAMDAVAVSYRAELLRFGIDTTIVVPGAFTHGTNHFAHSGTPADGDVASAYEEFYPGLMDQVGARLAELEPSWADVGAVADAIVSVVGAEKPPFRVHVDPSDDGAEVVNKVADRVRSEFLRRVELADLI